MSQNLTLNEIAFACVILFWIGLCAILVIGRRGASSQTRKRSVVSHLGFAFQICAYAVIYIFHRPFFTPIIPMSRATEAVLLATITAIGAASVWFCYEAAKALGKQWALAARVIEGHELISSGPFRIVRNPIYLGMFGLLLDAGITAARLDSFAAATALFLAGTWIRIRSEEKILRDTFGARFDEYARCVPAFIPRFL